VQRLHLVGFTSELDGLIFSANTGARSGGYVVALDDELLNVIRGVLARRDGPRVAPLAPSPQPRGEQGRSAPRGSGASALAPREIQARLRAGRSIEEVALEAGVDDEWIRRFASPVFAEQAHVVSRAVRVVFDGDGVGPSAEPLLGSVAANLAAQGMVLTSDELASGWSAFQMRDAAWVVQFRTLGAAKELVARWGFDVRSGTLLALNRPAAELGWLDGTRSGRSAFAAVTEDAPPAGAAPNDGDPPGRSGGRGETTSPPASAAASPRRRRPAPAGTAASPPETSPAETSPPPSPPAPVTRPSPAAAGDAGATSGPARPAPRRSPGGRRASPGGRPAGGDSPRRHGAVVGEGQTPLPLVDTIVAAPGAGAALSPADPGPASPDVGGDAVSAASTAARATRRRVAPGA